MNLFSMTFSTKLQKRLLAIAYISISCIHLQGQNLLWVNAMDHAKATGITTDIAGNTYMTGTFDHTVDFDPGPGVANATSDQNSDDIYVVKLDHSGNLVWFRTVGGYGDDNSKAISVDPSGNVILIGNFQYGLDFSNVGYAPSNDDFYAWKLAPSGNTLWVKGFAAGYGTVVNDLAVSPTGDILLTGNYNGTIDMDPSTGVDIQTSSYSSPFLIKLDNNGQYLWSQTFETTTFDPNDSYHVEVDSFGIYVGGVFSGIMDLDPDPIQQNLLTGPLYHTSIFALKLSHSGNLMWADMFPSYSYMVLGGLESDGYGNVYLCGTNTFPMDCDPSATGVVTVSANPNNSAFLIKLNPLGQYITSGSLVNNYDADLRSMEVDDEGNIHVVTFVEGGEVADVLLGAPEQVEGNDTLGGAVIVKYASDLSVLWVGRNLGLWGLLSAYDTHLASDGSLLLTGYFSTRTDLDPEDGILKVTSPSFNFGAFAYKLNCRSGNSYSSVTSCDSVAILGQTFTQSGLHYFQIPDGQGCDSTITVNVGLLAPTIFPSNYRLYTQFIDQAQYQWLDCANNYAVIPSQTSYEFDVQGNGNYAVAVSLQGCTDTSACYYVGFVGAEAGPDAQQTFRIAQLHEGFRVLQPGPFTATLIDLQGRVLATLETEEEATFDMGGFPSGVYLVRVRTEAGVASRKVMWMAR